MAIRVAESVVAAPSREEAGGLPDGGNGADHRRLPAMDAPVVIEVTDLTKRFGAGVVAVDDLSFTVRRGQVVGLLGPNGAGKTTTLRALLGLIRPTSGTMAIFGETIRPGIAVLSRVGALVEGPGFVPHLSGRRNLELYWRAGGRALSDAHLEHSLDISGLGPAADRKVKTYSHGMRQRLGFAQALLGKPELLVLDEPVNGLDPRQIVEVRESLLRIAASGTTILLSSHLLSEVEQTCSHVVVVHRGRLMQAGTVAEVTASVASAYLEVDDPNAAAALLAGLPGVRSVEPSPPGIVVQLDGAERSDLVAALVGAGLRVDTVTPRRNLEDAFLELVGEHSV
jgi:ABC-2 type transport system ATP-binding protein